MDSFDGSRRRDSRSPMPPSDRRSGREPEARSARESPAFEQRLDRWVSTGRQLVEGVAGSRPGSRPSARRPDGRPGGRGGFDGLGRWVENRLDWLLDDGDDWREPWQESDLRRSDERAPAASPIDSVTRPAQTPRNDSRRRPLEAISRRAATAPVPTPTPAAPAAQGSDDDWPDDAAFSVPRWQRPTTPLRRPDPLQTEQSERRASDAGDSERQAQSGRPLPRSSRRR